MCAFAGEQYHPHRLHRSLDKAPAACPEKAEPGQSKHASRRSCEASRDRGDDDGSQRDGVDDGRGFGAQDRGQIADGLNEMPWVEAAAFRLERDDARAGRLDRGAMLANAQGFLSIRPELAVYPALCIIVVALGFTLLGESLREALDPKFRR